MTTDQIPPEIVDSIKGFHKAKRNGDKALYERALKAGLVLGLFRQDDEFGLQAGTWRDGMKYPPYFKTMCQEACISTKRIVRDAKSYWHYFFLNGQYDDFPDWLADPALAPANMIAKGLSLAHFEQVRVLAAIYPEYNINAHQQLYDLAQAVEGGDGPKPMRREIENRINGERKPDEPPEPARRANAIIGHVKWLANNDLHNDDGVKRAASLLYNRIKRTGWINGI